MDTRERLSILTEAARYDVACTSSGVDRDAVLGHLGSTSCGGICHSFAADGRCISLLKVLLTNACSFDCAYCVNRRSNDVPRACFEPHELADLTMEFYRRNYIEGLFISSGIIGSPDRTMELMCEVARILRIEEGFQGYIHAKTIPGASPELTHRLGLLVDRLSVNIELPSSDSLAVLAPDKDGSRMLDSIGFIAERIAENAEERRLARRSTPASFAPAGQSTQLIVGASPENDYQILSLSKNLYKAYDLKRVFYSAYLPVSTSRLLPDASVGVPLDREHRLYQADWLMRYYEFDADELISPSDPYLDTHIDPKASWALRNIDRFPVDVNSAPYEMLLRVPGLGVTGARKVVRARRHHGIDEKGIRKMGLSLKRMQYFITFSGRYAADLPFDRDRIYARLALSADKSGKRNRGGGRTAMEGQLPLLDSPTLDDLESLQAFPEHGNHELTAGQESAYAAQRELLAQIRLRETGRMPLLENAR